MFGRKGSYGSWDVTQSFRKRGFRVQIPSMLEEEVFKGFADLEAYSYFQDLPGSSSTLPGVALSPEMPLLKYRSHSFVI